MKFNKIKDFLKTFDPLLLSYFPFIGWFIPMIKKKDDDFYMYHAKQGFILALFFTCVCIFLYLLPFFISTKTQTLNASYLLKFAHILKFIIALLIYILYAIYIALAVIGTRMIIKMEKKEFPYIGAYIAKYASKLNI